MTDLVVVSLEAWDTVWRRNQHLIAGLLRTDPELRVLFVEPPADLTHQLIREHRVTRPKGLRPHLVEGVAGQRLWLHQPIKAFPRRLDPRADERIARSVLRAAKRVGLTHPVLWINDPDGAPLVDHRRLPALYDVTDDWTLAPRPVREVARLVRYEGLLLRNCQEVVVCSRQLETSKSAFRPVTLIPNAVDSDSYLQAHDRPHDLPTAPVALYAGTIHRDRIDVDLCVLTARELTGQGARLVFVGPNLLADDETRLISNAGGVFLGSQHSDLVPAYLQHAETLVVPHVVTPFTDSLDPIKLYEYLAARRPIVATPVAGFRDHPSPAISVEAASTFPRAVGQRVQAADPAVPEPPPSDLPTWADRVIQMREVLDRVESATR